MRGGQGFSRFGRRFLFIAAAALLTASAITAQQQDAGSRQPSSLNAEPTILGPGDYFAGTPWIGQAPVTVTVAELMEREANAAPISGAPRERRHEQSER